MNKYSNEFKYSGKPPVINPIAPGMQGGTAVDVNGNIINSRYKFQRYNDEWR